MASTLTVADWLTWTEPMSDSLTETAICIRLRSASTMKPEALDEDDAAAFDELAEANADEAEPEAPEPDEPEPDEPEPDAPPLPAVTALPTWPEIDAIVPAAAEYSFVPDKAVWSLFTVSCALATAASAVARFAAIVAGEAVVVVPAGLPEPDVLPRAEVVPVPLDAPVAPAAPVVPFAGVDG